MYMYMYVDLFVYILFDLMQIPYFIIFYEALTSMRNDAKSLEKDLNKPEKVSRWKVTNKQVSSIK